MDSGFSRSPRFPNDSYARKKMKFSEGKADGKVTDHSHPYAITNWLQLLEHGKFGSVTKEIEDLLRQRAEVMNALYRTYPVLANSCVEQNPCQEIVVANTQPCQATEDNKSIILLEDNPSTKTIEIIDLDDEEDDESKPFSGEILPARPFRPFQEVFLKNSAGEFRMRDFLSTLPVLEERDRVQRPVVTKKAKGEKDSVQKQAPTREAAEKSETKKEKDKSETKKEKDKSETKKEKENSEMKKEKDKGVYLGVDDDDMETDNWNPQFDAKFDGLADIWQEMTMALECSKDDAGEAPSDDKGRDSDDECEHSFLLKDDIGYVCRICGVIQKKIETIIEYQKPKNTRNPRLFRYEGRTRDKDDKEIFADEFKRSDDEFLVRDICIHPKHSREMKSHQIEGFNFLLSNLVTDNPGGCILAHAPGSGKTFMVISFLQSFMAKYPSARPLIVLPKGILDTWKNEFRKWQVENIPIFDCYSGKSEGRAQQLEILNKWVAERSILLVGYKQFSAIVCDMSQISIQCQKILLECPSILILDEGHTPRTQDTDMFSSLEKVLTPRKVILSGTLYQNHVKEVFNILNLVRPKFLRMENSKAIKRRILSRVPVYNRKNLSKKGTDNEFYDLVEHTLLKDDNFKRKATVIQDLREMTSKVLHYYKGEWLDELPGLVDFTVFLNLSPSQKRELPELRKFTRKFKVSSDGSALYVHPQLKTLLKNQVVKDRGDEDKIDALLENLDINEGVKCKFYLNLLRLCESAGEKLLVFSPYIPPLKFLERLTVKVKGWSSGREIFMITGDSVSEEREVAKNGFNNSPDARVFFGSIKACGEGISLVGASRIIILDVHLNPSVTRQAIGRAFRPGQTKKVYTYRLIAAESPEEEDHTTCFKKELIAKLWFEWNEYCGQINFEMESANVQDCGDLFLETPFLHQDVTSLYKR